MPKSSNDGNRQGFCACRLGCVRPRAGRQVSYEWKNGCIFTVKKQMLFCLFYLIVNT